MPNQNQLLQMLSAGLFSQLKQGANVSQPGASARAALIPGMFPPPQGSAAPPPAQEAYNPWLANLPPGAKTTTSINRMVRNPAADRPLRPYPPVRVTRNPLSGNPQINQLLSMSRSEVPAYIRESESRKSETTPTLTHAMDPTLYAQHLRQKTLEGNYARPDVPIQERMKVGRDIQNLDDQAFLGAQPRPGMGNQTPFQDIFSPGSEFDELSQHQNPRVKSIGEALGAALPEGAPNPLWYEPTKGAKAVDAIIESSELKSPSKLINLLRLPETQKAIEDVPGSGAAIEKAINRLLTYGQSKSPLGQRLTQSFAGEPAERKGMRKIARDVMERRISEEEGAKRAEELANRNPWIEAFKGLFSK